MAAPGPTGINDVRTGTRAQKPAAATTTKSIMAPSASLTKLQGCARSAPPAPNSAEACLVSPRTRGHALGGMHSGHAPRKSPESCPNVAQELIWKPRLGPNLAQCLDPLLANVERISTGIGPILAMRAEFVPNLSMCVSKACRFEPNLSRTPGMHSGHAFGISQRRPKAAVKLLRSLTLGPKLANSGQGWPIFPFLARWPRLSRIWSLLSDVCHILANVGRWFSGCCRCWQALAPNVGHFCPNIDRGWQHIGQILNLAEAEAKSPEIGPDLSHFGRDWESLGRCSAEQPASNFGSR